MAGEKTNNYAKCPHNTLMTTNLKWAPDVAELSLYTSLSYLLAFHTFPSLLKF